MYQVEFQITTKTDYFSLPYSNEEKLSKQSWINAGPENCQFLSGSISSTMEEKTLNQQIDDVLNDPAAKRNVDVYQFQQW